jgi:hypothetical protein
MKADGSIKVVMCDHQAVVLRNFVVETEIFWAKMNDKNIKTYYGNGEN